MPLGHFHKRKRIRIGGFSEGKNTVNKHKINFKIMTKTTKKPTTYFYKVLGAVALICVLLFGTIEYANSLSQRIKDKNELRELKKELLKLEIMKLEGKCNCT